MAISFSASPSGLSLSPFTSSGRTTNAAAYGNAYADQTYGGGSSFFIFDVTDTSTHKVKFRYISAGSAIFEGNTSRNWQVATFIRLGDT